MSFCKTFGTIRILHRPTFGTYATMGLNQCEIAPTRQMFDSLGPHGRPPKHQLEGHIPPPGRSDRSLTSFHIMMHNAHVDFVLHNISWHYHHHAIVCGRTQSKWLHQSDISNSLTSLGLLHTVLLVLLLLEISTRLAAYSIQGRLGKERTKNASIPEHHVDTHPKQRSHIRCVGRHQKILQSWFGSNYSLMNSLSKVW